MKHKQHQTVKGHVGYLCRLEGGKSQAKIHDAIQIMNLHYDVILQEWIESAGLSIEDVKDIAIDYDFTYSKTSDTMLTAAAFRWLKRNKKK